MSIVYSPQGSPKIRNPAAGAEINIRRGAAAGQLQFLPVKKYHLWSCAEGRGETNFEENKTKTMNSMKFYVTTLLLLLGISVKAQWLTPGNVIPPGGPYLFGTLNNYPVHSITNNIFRMRLNPDISYVVNGFNASRNGYLLLGVNNNSMSGNGSMYTNNRGAYSLLHLNGPGNFAQEYGYRPWMQTGITFTGNNDLSYIGLRKLSTLPTEQDLSETVFAWSDNTGSNLAEGPDDLAFRFISYDGYSNPATTNAAISANLSLDNDLDGLHVARFTPDGRMGLGNTFGVDATGMSVGYVRPQSLLHMSLSDGRPVWQQFTSRGVTNENDTDGVRIGLAPNNLNGYMYNQENAALVFSTNAFTATELSRERMRLTHIGATGVPTVTGVVENTRLSVSLTPATSPITGPSSLVHIGTQPTAYGSNGLRKWMNVGYNITHGTDNMYIGIKEEGSSDRQDAVVAWGDNKVTGNTDNLRFIFTGQLSTITPPANGANGENGLETGRFTPDCPVCPVNKPSFGIGDFSPSGTNPPGGAGYIGATIDVAGDARIRSVVQNNALNQVLVRNPADSGRVHWRDASTLGGAGSITANNGLIIFPAGNVQFGQALPGGSGAQLLNDREVPMSGFDVLFSGLGSAGNNIFSLGALNSLGAAFSAKNFTWNDTEINSGLFYNYAGNRSGSTNPIDPGLVGVQGRIDHLLTGPNNGLATKSLSGVYGHADGTANTVPYQHHLYGVYGEATHQIPAMGATLTVATGVFGRTNAVSGATLSYGGYFMSPAPLSSQNYGVYGEGVNGHSLNVGGEFKASSPSSPSALNFAVRCTTPVDSIGSYALYVNGDAFCVGVSPTFGSDSLLKTNIKPIGRASELLSKINTYTYDYKVSEFPTLNLDKQNHFGVLAQNVEKVLPNLVKEFRTPEVTDGSGAVTSPGQTLKGVKYNEFIPLLIAGFNEQQKEKETQAAALADMQRQLDELKDLLTQCCQSRGVSETNVNFTSDGSQSSHCVLNANAPNPFEDHTLITYSIPAEAKFAQIIFYNTLGQAIKIVDISHKGEGRLNVFGDDLKSGLYTYSLIIDGKLCETRKMIKE